MKKTIIVMLFFILSSNAFGSEAEEYFQSALSQYLGNHYSNAVPNLKWAIKLNGSNWRAHQLLGYCHFMLKDEKSALDECRLSLKYHGDNPRLENFVDFLKAKGLGENQKEGQYYFGEGKAEAQMPAPPNKDPDRKPDIFIEGLEVKVPASKVPEVPFLKIGGGLIFSEEFNSSGGVDQSISGLATFTPSFSLGMECPDDFSFYVSGEWLNTSYKSSSLGEGAILANAQWSIPGSNGIKPYLFAGLGLDIAPHDFPLGIGFQSGIGSEISLSQNNDCFYVEGKLFKGIGFSSPGNFWQGLYFPILTAGLKLKL